LTDLEKRLAALSPEQRKVLLRRLNREATPKDTEEQTISPQARETNVFPLSFSQQRLWILDKMGPGNAAYNLPMAIRFRGTLHVTALEKCINEIVHRHETLRTSFTVVDGNPMQVVHPPLQLPLRVVDLSSWPAAEIELEALNLISEESQRAFDLEHAPLLRTTLLKLSETEHIFLILVHHIVSDAWSMVVFMRELETLYRGFCNGESPQLPPLSIQYADFAQWQLHWVESGGIEAQLAYWREQLGGELPQLDILLNRPRPATPSNRSKHINLKLPVALSKALNELSHAEQATLFMTMLAAFKLLLQRCTGLDDIIVGTPIAGRNRAEVENLIGFFINTLVLRTNLSGSPTFRELIQRVKKIALDAYTHQDVPFEALLVELHPERDLNRTPLFQVFFNMINLDEQKTELPGLVMEGFDMPDIGSKFDLTMYLTERVNQIELTLVYNKDLFYPERMTELLAQYEILLLQIVANPNQTINQFDLETERAKVSLPDPQVNLPQDWDEPTHYMFMKQAKRAPNNIALVDKFDSWTYQELDLHSNQVAHCLQENGIGPQDIVAIYAHRSAALIVALLGIWKAGGAFLILDPAHPAQRQIDYLHNAKPKAWIHLKAAGIPPQHLSEFIEESGYCCQLEMPSTKKEIGLLLHSYSSSSPTPTVKAGDLAYIAFTSGSMGRPKGIVGIHGPISHFFKWQVKRFSLLETDRFSMLSGLAHDPLMRDLFTPLTIGAMLCIPDQEEILSTLALFSWMKEQHISVSHLTPAMEQILVGVKEQTTLEDLRYAFFAGETLTWRHVTTLKEVAPTVTCVNFYGATETPQAMGYTVIDSVSPVKDDSSTSYSRQIPIGQGIDAVQLLILNTAGQRCGIGEIGEIYIRTPHLSMGYLNDDELTRQRFVVNPFTKDTSDRVYKTGDLGRYHPNGDVEFMGRKDRQVKVRGFRVELSEIEAVLHQHSMVKQSIVSIWDADEGDKRLAAYIIPQEKGFNDSTILREYLKQHLPSYMIPGSFIFLDVFPITPNGKIDYRALPPSDMGLSRERDELVAARNTTEEKLLGIWEEILKKHPIGVKDSFFELGGHSLIAVHMFTRINHEFDVNLPLATLFQEPTIEHLANIIQQHKKGKQTWSSLIAIEPSGMHPPFFCVHGLTGDILWFRDLARYLSPDYPFYGLQSRGLDGIQAPLERIEEMSAHYIVEIRRFQPKGPYYLGGASFGGTVALEMAQQLLAQGEKVAMLAIFDHAPPNIKLDEEKGKIRRRMTILYRVLRNFPHWLAEFIKLGPSGMWLRASRKLRLIKKINNQADINQSGSEQLNAHDLIDFASELSAHRQQLITSNHQALKAYIPTSYAGKITLFRALNRPLLNVYDPESGWQKLAPGRVEVFDIPSSHEGMFKKPSVDELAKKLKACLDG
jgi:amino acid adenylation domain-containing protein